MELLVKRAKRGDAEAFITLIEQNKLSMYKVARGFLRNEEDVADVMQEIFLLKRYRRRKIRRFRTAPEIFRS